MDSIIFDLDGTLWNTTETLSVPWTQTLNAHGVNKHITAKDLEAVMGKDVPGIAAAFMPELPEADRISIAYKACAAETPYLQKLGGKLYPELEGTLKKLYVKYKLFIVSNCEEEYINAFWDFHGLKHYFSDAEYIGRTHLPKKDNISLIIQRHSLNAPVYVGDTDMDFYAASANHIPFVFASYGFGHSDSFSARLDQISDLPKIAELL